MQRLKGASGCGLAVPIRHGGGTRLKILEAMALGTPVISTSKGAEGLDAQDGREILIADATTDVVRHLRGTSEHDRLQMAEKARMKTLSRHTGLHRAHELENYFMEAAEKSGRATRNAAPSTRARSTMDGGTSS